MRISRGGLHKNPSRQMARIGQDLRGCLVHSKRVILIPLFSRAFFRRLYMLFKKNLREGWLYMLFKKNLREGYPLSQLTARFNYRSNWLSTKLAGDPWLDCACAVAVRVLLASLCKDQPKLLGEMIFLCILSNAHRGGFRHGLWGSAMTNPL